MIFGLDFLKNGSQNKELKYLIY